MPRKHDWLRLSGGNRCEPARLRTVFLSLDSQPFCHLSFRRKIIQRNWRRENADGRIAIVRPSRRVLRELLRMRKAEDGTKIIPHPEEAAKRPSRRTHDWNPALRRFAHSFGSRNPQTRPVIMDAGFRRHYSRMFGVFI